MEKRHIRNMEIKRKPLQGVLNILSFNRHFYYIGLILIVTLISSQKVFNWPEHYLYTTLALVTFGLIMPLIVSAYVYDFSKYYTFNWLDKLKLKNLKHIANINAGFDETSHIIKHKFPEANLKVFDFYNEKKHTEKAIIRARKASNIYPNTLTIPSNNIPLKTNSMDAVFLLSTVHEIRSNEEKIIFLKECYRVCKPNGHVIMVEHLRDTANFIAFSVGFTHFFTKKTWLKVFKKANFKIKQEYKFTPFMSIFNFKKIVLCSFI